MKLNIANPATGCQKLLEYDDEKRMRIFWDKRIAQEVEADVLGDEWKGYVLRITGGNDKQGFPMMQGVLTNNRVRLLLDKNSKCFRERRSGERRRKSVRGCIAAPDLSVLSLVIVKKGPSEIPGLTDKHLPQRLGPKRASKIRKLFNLTKEDDVRKFVVRRKLPNKPPTHKGKAPKIQRLVTPLTLQRKRRRLALKKQWAAKSRAEAAAYAKILAQRRKEAKARRQALISRRRSSAKSGSEKKSGSVEAKKPAATTTKAAEPKKAPAAKPAATQKPAPKAGAGTGKGGKKGGAKAGTKAGAKAGAGTGKGGKKGGQKGGQGGAKKQPPK